jgi:dTMP kinase
LGERGGLIAFEGIEGAGKSTQLRLAGAALRQRGFTVVETREPGGTALGVELRRLAMEPRAVNPAPLTELLLYLGDRAQHLAELVTPAITQGAIVLTDRFSASTIAYQGFARRLDIDTVSRLDAIVRDGVAPACTILLDCPVEIGLPRAQGNDRFHREDLEFHERVRRAFLSLAAADPERFCVLDSTAPPEQIHQQIMAAILQCLQNR